MTKNKVSLKNRLRQKFLIKAISKKTIYVNKPEDLSFLADRLKFSNLVNNFINTKQSDFFTAKKGYVYMTIPSEYLKIIDNHFKPNSEYLKRDSFNFLDNIRYMYKFYLVHTNDSINAEVVRRYSKIDGLKILPKVVTTVKTALSKKSISCILGYRHLNNVYRSFSQVKLAFAYIMCILQDAKKIYDAGLKIELGSYLDFSRIEDMSVKVFEYVSLNEENSTFEEFAKEFIISIFDHYLAWNRSIHHTSNRYEHSYWITDELYEALTCDNNEESVDFFSLIKQQYLAIMDKETKEIKEKYWLCDDMFDIDDNFVPICVETGNVSKFLSIDKNERQRLNMVRLYLKLEEAKGRNLLTNETLKVRHFSASLDFLGCTFLQHENSIKVEDFLRYKRDKENMVSVYTALIRTVLNFLFLIKSKVEIFDENLDRNNLNLNYKIHFSRNIDIHNDLYVIKDNDYPYFVLKDYSIFEVGYDEDKNAEVISRFILDILAEISDYEVINNNITGEMEVAFKSFSLINYLDADIVVYFERHIASKYIGAQSFLNKFIESAKYISSQNFRYNVTNKKSSHMRALERLDDLEKLVFYNSFLCEVPVVLFIHNNSYEYDYSPEYCSEFIRYYVDNQNPYDLFLPINAVCIVANREGDMVGYVIKKPEESFRVLSKEIFEKLDELQIIKIFSNLYKIASKNHLNNKSSQLYPKLNEDVIVDKDLNVFFDGTIETLNYNEFIKNLMDTIYEIRKIKWYIQTTIEDVIENKEIDKLLLSEDIVGTYSEKYNMWYFFDDILQIGRILYKDCSFGNPEHLTRIFVGNSYEIFKSNKSHKHVIRYTSKDVDISLSQDYIKEEISSYGKILRDSSDLEPYGIEINEITKFLDLSKYSRDSWKMCNILYSIIQKIFDALKTKEYFAFNASMYMNSLDDVFLAFKRVDTSIVILINPIMNIKKNDIEEERYSDFNQNVTLLINKIYEIICKIDEAYDGQFFKYYISESSLKEAVKKINDNYYNNFSEVFDDLRAISGLFLFSRPELLLSNYCRYHDLHFDTRFKSCPKCKEEFGDNILAIRKGDFTESMKKGGESLIYECDEDNLYKIYRKGSDGRYLVDIDSKIKILMHLISLKQEIEDSTKEKPFSIIVPNNLLMEEEERNICGFSMKKIANAKCISCLMDIEYAKSKKWTNKDILNVLINLGEALEYLNQNGWYIGDFNGGNILFDENYHVYVIDTDSLGGVNENIPTKFVSSFLDPNATIDKDGNVKVSINTDYYSYALICFSCLTGLHPFGGVYRENKKIVPLDVRMKRGISVLRKAKIKLPDTIFKWEWMSDELKNEFLDIFEGKKRESILPLLKKELSILGGEALDNKVVVKESKFKNCNANQSPKLKVLFDLSLIKSKNRKIFSSNLLQEDTEVLYNIHKEEILIIPGSIGKGKLEDAFFTKDPCYLAVIKNNTLYLLDGGTPATLHILNVVDVSQGKVFHSLNGKRIYMLRDDGQIVNILNNSNISFDILNIAPLFKLSDFKLSEDGKIGVAIRDKRLSDKKLCLAVFDFTEKGKKVIVDYKLDYINSVDSIYVDTFTNKDIFVFDNSLKKGIFANFKSGRYEVTNIDIDENLTDKATLYKNILFYPKKSKIVAINLNTMNKKEFDCNICNKNCRLIRIENGFEIIDEGNLKIYRYTV